MQMQKKKVYLAPECFLWKVFILVLTLCVFYA